MTADCFFELSWEVCNKVGGIYTVITSKAAQMMKTYNENYYAIGPYLPGRSKVEDFKEQLPPAFLKDIFEKLHKIGIKCHYGKWLIEGQPNTILVEYEGYSYKLSEIKTENWVKFKIDSLGSQYHDYDEPILWSTCCGILLETIKTYWENKKIVCQCHEWMAGGALLYLKSRAVRIGSVFTTHATILGRTLASNHVDLYGELSKINPDERAKNFGIQAKHLTEKACAQNSDVFTTVSEITGMEATYFLGKKPDVLLPNGLDIQAFPTFDEASIKHKSLKAKVRRFLMYYFFPYYQFELDDTLYFFLLGRYEFHDKGIDICIKALGKLNEHLKESYPDKTVVVFFWVPAGVKEIRPELLQNKSYFDDVAESVNDRADELKEKVIYGLISKKQLDYELLFGKSFLLEAEKKVLRFAKDGNPSPSTHYLYNEQDDEILRAFKANGLNNSKGDRVKVIFYPIYLTGADQLLDLSYYEAIMACHLGVFPSYYEPWGYTPLEAGACGIASVTTDLAGFGKYVQKISDSKKKQGIYVLDRLNKSDDEVADNLFKVFSEFAISSKQDRIENKLRAKRIADTADWALMAENYLKAHNLAAERNG